MDALHNIQMTKTAKGQENLMPQTNNVLATSQHQVLPFSTHTPTSVVILSPGFFTQRSSTNQQIHEFWAKEKYEQIRFLLPFS
jgi:hypothetical protein